MCLIKVVQKLKGLVSDFNNNYVGSFINPLCIWLCHILFRNIFLVGLVIFLYDDLMDIERNGILTSKNPIQRITMDIKVIIRIMDNIHWILLSYKNQKLNQLLPLM